jgi:hypothetical protein
MSTGGVQSAPSDEALLYAELDLIRLSRRHARRHGVPLEGVRLVVTPTRVRRQPPPVEPPPTSYALWVLAVAVWAICGVYAVATWLRLR